MEKTLKSLVDHYKKGLLTTPNIQVTNMIFSDEVLEFPDGSLLDLSFNCCLVKDSQLTSITIYNGYFGLGYFIESTLENCTFVNTHFQEWVCEKCVFKNCSFIDCRLIESEISETIFSNCKFEKCSLADSEFHSCGFINPIFSDVLHAFTIIRDSKFSKFNKSINFEGKFFLSDILSSKSGIWGILKEDWY